MAIQIERPKPYEANAVAPQAYVKLNPIQVDPLGGTYYTQVHVYESRGARDAGAKPMEEIDWHVRSSGTQNFDPNQFPGKFHETSVADALSGVSITDISDEALTRSEILAALYTHIKTIPNFAGIINMTNGIDV